MGFVFVRFAQAGSFPTPLEPWTALPVAPAPMPPPRWDWSRSPLAPPLTSRLESESFPNLRRARHSTGAESGQSCTPLKVSVCVIRLTSASLCTGRCLSRFSKEPQAALGAHWEPSSPTRAASSAFLVGLPQPETVSGLPVRASSHCAKGRWIHLPRDPE